ncbi:uncharacterized protein SPPG_00034 [Spizellomyces punctatus DAOM BR117]|uniref:DNA-binding protein RAP1 n=1 Tax=Spizellomyces punctatus (strain DAOM BR117) TaxID=645134 RepID=A0A0L0HSG6_SPIPD|nr:uncharacterized protein SPPG_00034 [Spizellomyces punctatus DAOM BR117]KND04301.1 hypothetical protein SPPG_00034 [Spizellomyces punctatus DAOM BR117]|eukprot:XP_016612340.1 hypothetical protein SPPG_00034 [Spizellomyces punctatus DAOM BR117]
MLTQEVIVKEEPMGKRNKKLLFADDRGDPLKFYVTRGLHRERIRKLIEEHGGQVVDVAGSDCFMKLGEPGIRTATIDLYSSEYVEDSVQTGQLLGRSPYALSLNGLPPGNRTSREPFTQKDKLHLRNHIEGHIKAGKLFGNEIYKEFASLFPHHSWQSWRDHAVKHILPTLPAAKKIDKRAERIRNPGQSPVDAEQSTTTSRDSGRRSDHFSKYEREVLEELLRISREKDRELVYSALAEQFTAHSQASWKHYAEEEVIPNMEDEGALLETGTDAPPPSRLKGVRREFSERDKALIRKITRNRLGDAGIKGKNFWVEFGLMHSQHSADSWRGHATKVIMPVLMAAQKILQNVRKKSTAEAVNENDANAGILPGAPQSKQLEDTEVSDVEYWSQETETPDDAKENDTGMWMTQPQSAPSVDEEQEEGEGQAEERDAEEEEEGEGQAEEREAEEEEDTPWQTQAPIGDTQDHERGQSSEEELAIATQASPLGRNTSDFSEKATSQSPRRPKLRNSPSKTQSSQAQATSPHPSPRKQLLSSPQDPNTQPASQTRRSISRNISREVESPHLMDRDEAPPTVEMVGSTEEELDSLLEEQARLSQKHAQLEEMASSAKGVAADEEGGTEEAPMDVDNSDTQYLTAPEGRTDENPFLASPTSSRVIKKKAVPLPEPSQKSPPATIPHVVLTPAPHHEVAESVKTQYYNLFDKLCNDYSSEGFTRHQCLGAVHMSGGVIGRARKLLDAGLDVAKLSSKIRRHIFTSDEDATLLGNDEQAIESLKKVKGREVISHRMRFLHQWSALHVGGSQ